MSKRILRTVPTVQDILYRTHVGGQYHDLPAEGGAIRVSRRDLLPILQSNYDPTDPHWFTEIDFESGCPDLPRQELI